MKIETNVKQLVCRWVLFSTVILISLLNGQATRAVEIVYEGFGYPTGYLGINDASSPVAIDLEIFDNGEYDGLDDGQSDFYDHDGDPGTPDIQPTVLGDPALAGGTGTWVPVQGWTKRVTRQAPGHFIFGDETLSYSDASGNQLVTTMGRPSLQDRGQNLVWRPFDASTLELDITLANDGSDTGGSASNFEVPTLGKQGSVVWLSFLGERNIIGSGSTAFQLWNKRDIHNLTGVGHDPQDRTAGFFGPDNTDWGWFDASFGAEGSAGPGATITGSARNPNNGDDPVFIVAKFDYNAADGMADVSFYVDPLLDAADPGTPNATTTAFIPFNAIAIGRGGSVSPTAAVDSGSVDEIRIGTTYADVSPFIAGGLDSDFDNDGDVDGGDFLKWQRGEAPGGATAANLTLWQGNFGAPGSVAVVSSVPEPTSILLFGFAIIWWSKQRRSE